MSDTPVDGWWQASNARWYPPETHPSFNLEGPVAAPEGWVRGTDGEWRPPADEPVVELPAEAEPAPVVLPTASTDLDEPDLSLLPPVAPVRPADADDAAGRRWPAIASVGVGVVVAILGIGTLVVTLQEDESPVKVGSETTIREIAPETVVTTTSTTIPDTSVPETTVADTTVPATELQATVPETVPAPPA